MTQKVFFLLLFPCFLFSRLCVCVCQMDVWPEVEIEKEYTGFDLQVEEPPLDEPR